MCQMNLATNLQSFTVTQDTSMTYHIFYGEREYTSIVGPVSLST